MCAHLGKKDSPFHSLSPLICSSPRTFFVRKCAPPFCSHYSYAKKAISRIIFGVGKKEEGDGGASVSFRFIPAVESEMTREISLLFFFSLSSPSIIPLIWLLRIRELCNTVHHKNGFSLQGKPFMESSL